MEHDELVDTLELLRDHVSKAAGLAYRSLPKTTTARNVIDMLTVQIPALLTRIEDEAEEEAQ